MYPSSQLSLKLIFKGTVSRDFRLLFFSWINVPQAPEYTCRAVSNFEFDTVKIRICDFILHKFGSTQVPYSIAVAVLILHILQFSEIYVNQNLIPRYQRMWGVDDSEYRWYGRQFFITSPRIQIQNRKGFNNSESDPSETDLYIKKFKTPSHWYVPLIFTFGVHKYPLSNLTRMRWRSLVFGDINSFVEKKI